MKRSDALATTTSLCPDCLEEVPGRYEERDGGVFLTRECPDHGSTSRQVWGSLDHWEWAAGFGPNPEYDGGDLTVDPDHVCLVVVEVTEDCNLSCSYCFASSGPGGAHRSLEDAHGKHVVGELEHGSDDFFESFSTKFLQETSTELKGSEIRRQFVF